MEGGHDERIKQLERRLATAESERRELWKSTGANNTRLAVIETQLEGLVDDVQGVADDCKATRVWVEARDQERKEADRTQQTLSAGQKAAVTAGIFLVFSTLITTLTTLANAGAFG